MSHLKERKEKNCLNCQATLIGRYCHVCGQENLEPKETVWHLVQHFFNDITHFDGKFFSTVKYLLWKPGFLSKEYVAGRRMSYLNPIRLYVFTSAFFFLILFALKNPKDMVHQDNKPDRGETIADLKKDRVQLLRELAGDSDHGDSLDTRKDIVSLDMKLEAIKKYYGDTTKRAFTSQEIGLLVAREINDSLPETKDLLSVLPLKEQQKIYKNIRQSVRKYSDSTGAAIAGGESTLFGEIAGNYRTEEAYDSAEKALPDSLRDGWLQRTVIHKCIAANIEFKRDRNAYFEHVAENILHSIPKVLFVSLPIFALILNIMYFRRRKTYFYVDHGIFTIHLYCATFILSMAIFLLSQLVSAFGRLWLDIVAGILIFGICVYIIIYLYKAMRGFYGQGGFKTFVKYCLICLFAFTVNLIIFVIFALLSVVSV
ncbi:MAG TPA: DUF3667 domain-containing protein [Puia sp.]|nr:DUF3667 domain-containing protein [Puia sp.]